MDSGPERSAPRHPAGRGVQPQNFKSERILASLTTSPPRWPRRSPAGFWEQPIGSIRTDPIGSPPQGWLRGTTLGGTARWDLAKRTYWYTEPNGQGGNVRKLS